MSARKTYYEGKKPSQLELDDVIAYIAKYPKLADCWFEELCDMWRPKFHPNGVSCNFMLVSYENCGATNGIVLIIYKDSNYVLSTYEESGYSRGYIIQAGVDLAEINKFIPGFKPERYIFD